MIKKTREPNFTVDDVVFGWFKRDVQAAKWHRGYTQVLGPYYTAEQQIIGKHFYHKLEDLLKLDWNYDGQRHVPEALKKCTVGLMVDIGTENRWFLRRLYNKTKVIILKKYEYRDKMHELDLKMQEILKPFLEERRDWQVLYNNIVQSC